LSSSIADFVGIEDEERQMAGGPTSEAGEPPTIAVGRQRLDGQ
jgi:hypothetical protein